MQVLKIILITVLLVMMTQKSNGICQGTEQYIIGFDTTKVPSIFFYTGDQSCGTNVLYRFKLDVYIFVVLSNGEWTCPVVCTLNDMQSSRYVYQTVSFPPQIYVSYSFSQWSNDSTSLQYEYLVTVKSVVSSCSNVNTYMGTANVMIDYIGFNATNTN